MLTTSLVPSVALADAETSISVGSDLPPLMFKPRKKKRNKKRRSKKKRRRSKPKDVKVGPELSPEDAEAKRQAIRESVVEAKEKEQWQEVAEGYEYNATILGDPVTMMEGADARYSLAAKERSVEEAENSIETSRKALDMLYFYQAVAAGETESLWLAIDPKTASDLVPDADAQIARAEKLIEEIEAEQSKEEPNKVAKRAEKKDKKKKRRRRGKVGPGTGLIAAGAALSAVGLAGAGMGVAGIVVSNNKQKEVEELGNMPGPDPDEINRLDEEGKRANILGFAGLGIAVAGIAVGVPLIAIGVKKRKEAGPSASASLRVAPMIGGYNQGFVLSGRF